MSEHEAVNKRCSKVRLFILSNMAKYRFHNFVSYGISNFKGIVESLIIPHMRRNVELYASVTWTHRWKEGFCVASCKGWGERCFL